MQSKRWPWRMALVVAAALGCSGSSQSVNAQLSEPKPTLELRVLVDGRRVVRDEDIPLKAGETAALKVELVRKDGVAVDVTHDPKTHYLSAAPWILSVSDAGVVTALTAPPAEFNIDVGDEANGPIAISYGLASDTEVGIAAVLFRVTRPRDPMREGALQIIVARTTLGVGETVPLTVMQRLAGGGQRDVTAASAATTYLSTNLFSLIVEPDGAVTCVGTSENADETVSVMAMNAGVSAWIRFRLSPKGPGPGLQVSADKTVLREGERTRLHVYQAVEGGGRHDLTAAADTRYSTFTDDESDPDVVTVNGAGVATATKSLGKANQLSALILVRHGDAIGWIALKVGRQ